MRKGHPDGGDQKQQINIPLKGAAAGQERDVGLIHVEQFTEA